MSAATTSKAEAFGAGLARAVKSLVLAERRLVAGAGSKGHLVKWGLLAMKLLVAGLLLATTLWAVVVLLPLLLAFALIAAGTGSDSSPQPATGLIDQYGLPLDDLGRHAVQDRFANHLN